MAGRRCRRRRGTRPRIAAGHGPPRPSGRHRGPPSGPAPARRPHRDRPGHHDRRRPRGTRRCRGQVGRRRTARERTARPAQHDPARITVLGGESAVSVAPFSELARRHGDDLAVIWIDSHRDIGTPDSEYHGCHAMAVAALTGHGDPDVLKLLPATVSPDRVALVGLHEWTDDDLPDIAERGRPVVRPERAARPHPALLAWLAATGCSRVAVHFDVDTVDTVDSDEIGLGLGLVPGGLTRGEVRRVVADIDRAADVVGLTIAEFVPRQVMHLQRLLNGFPLLHGR
ncbi:arginase family protein [Streptomyces sp. CA-179760]|uniref:arginase family protein n=1 Tax=Streptomyces sp. CA-179760 TaxID=3240054 RepID=UPI003D946081